METQNESYRFRPRLTYDTALYRDRKTVERTVDKLKDWRGLATRYDKTPESCR